MGDAYIAGLGFHPFGRFPHKTLKEIAAEAVLNALDDAGLTWTVSTRRSAQRLCGLLTGQESIRGETWLRAVGVGGIPIINVENACAGGGAALHLATMAVRSGAYKRVLVVGAEKMFGDTGRAIAALATSSDIEFTGGIGMQFSAVDAIRVKKLMAEENARRTRARMGHLEEPRQWRAQSDRAVPDANVDGRSPCLAHDRGSRAAFHVQRDL